VCAMMSFRIICDFVLVSLLVREGASQKPFSGRYHRSTPQLAANDDLDDSSFDHNIDLAEEGDDSYMYKGEEVVSSDEEDDLEPMLFDLKADHAALLAMKTAGRVRSDHDQRLLNGRRREGGTEKKLPSWQQHHNNPHLLEESSGDAPCVGHFAAWSSCQKSCYQWREFSVDSQAKDGGAACDHPDRHVERKPCTGGDCELEELPPTGDLPSEEKPATHLHDLAMDVALPFATAIVLSMSVGEVVHHVPWLSAIPHSLVTILVAGSMGFLLRAHEDRFGADTFSPVCTAVMNLVLLPIIIFQAGWSMRHRDFAANFPYIVIFAVFGTAISTIIIGCIVVFTGALGWHVVTGVREAFAIAALISATDPVATLAAFAVKKVEPHLNIMVLGESTINDAVAIALFNMLNIDEPTAYWFFPSAAMATFKLLFVSIAIGFIAGAILVMLFRGVRLLGRHQGGEDHGTEEEEGSSFEVVYVLGSAYFINAVAESFHMSGIIACLFGGITMGIYIRPHMSVIGEQHATYYITTAAETADLTVFIMVGVTTALIKSSKGFRFGAFLLLFCLVGRALTVAICGLSCNGLHRARFGGALMDFLPVRKMVVMWHSGLRGGIALTLALQLNDWCEHKAVLVTGTFIVIFALMVMMGSTIDIVLKACSIETNCAQEKIEYKDIHSLAQEAPGGSGWFHNRVLHPMLVGDEAAQKQKPPV